MTSQRTLTSKTVGPYTADGMIATSPETIAQPAYTVYRFVDENGKGGCWYASMEKAEQSWQRAHVAA